MRIYATFLCFGRNFLVLVCCSGQVSTGLTPAGQRVADGYGCSLVGSANIFSKFWIKSRGMPNGIPIDYMAFVIVRLTINKLW
jgi:hypothetical protein